MNDIAYNESDAGFNIGFKDVTQFFGGRGPIILSGGIVDGGGYTMSGFPPRRVGASRINGTGRTFASGFLLASLGRMININFISPSRVWGSESGESVTALGYVAGVGAGEVIGISVAGSMTRILETSTRMAGMFGMIGASTDAGTDGFFEGVPGTDGLNMTNVTNFASVGSFNNAAGINCLICDVEGQEYSFKDIKKFGAIGFFSDNVGLFYIGEGVAKYRLNGLTNYGGIGSRGDTNDGGNAGLLNLIPNGDTNQLNNLANYGSIVGNRIGGIAATAATGTYTLEGLKNFGDIKGGGSTEYGAFIGRVDLSLTTITFKNCYNNGTTGHWGNRIGGANVRFIANDPTLYHGDNNGNISEVKS